jgi:hypothetical protein
VKAGRDMEGLLSSGLKFWLVAAKCWWQPLAWQASHGTPPPNARYDNLNPEQLPFLFAVAQTILMFMLLCCCKIAIVWHATEPGSGTVAALPLSNDQEPFNENPATKESDVMVAVNE